MGFNEMGEILYFQKPADVSHKSPEMINRLFIPIMIVLQLFMASGLLLAQQDKTQIPTNITPGLLGELGKRQNKTVPLARPIDPRIYKLGPGDQITIFVWGNFQAQYDLTVTPEGKLLVPTIGPLGVSGLSLDEAKSLIENNMFERYQNVKLAVNLTDLRNFRVYVGGAVKTPGVYTADGVTLVSEVIALAGGFANEEPTINRWPESENRTDFPTGIASHRNILVKHFNGLCDTADVFKFEASGDLSHNFTVLDGDEIFVPLREKNINLYGIFGGVRNPGYFEYSARDSLKDLINLGHGLALNVDSVEAELVRFNADAKTTSRITLPLKEILTGRAPDIHLLSDDRVFIKTLNNYHDKQQVLVLGQVKFPGFYAIKPESTSLTQVITQTGGFTPLASLAEAEMTRFTFEEVKDREFERLKLMQVKDMSDVEYEYFKMKSREKPGRVAVDFVKLFRGKGEGDIRLKDGDIILIPKISEVVNVSGEVANPGLLSYNPEYDYLAYVNLAGGFSFRANKSQARIIKGATGEWKKANRKTKLDPGDTILVPEKKKINYLNTAKDIMVFAGNLATVYLVIKQASK
jgi:protein involved in polysaccharide export with SLBB domain